MHIHIITDMEGISEVTSIDHMDPVLPEHQTARTRLMADVNAAISGCFSNGATRVTVTDGHYKGKNFIEGMLDKRAENTNFFQLTENDMHKTVDAVIFIGTHAMAGTENAFLDHTQSSATWYNYYLNDIKCGELVQGGAFFGAYDIPVIMVSGDEAACSEALHFFGDISVAPVKKALSRNTAKSYGAQYCESLIEQKAAQAMDLVSRVKPYKVTEPISIRLELMRSDYADEMAKKPGVHRLDARTVIKRIEKITDYHSILF